MWLLDFVLLEENCLIRFDRSYLSLNTDRGKKRQNKTRGEKTSLNKKQKTKARSGACFKGEESIPCPELHECQVRGLIPVDPPQSFGVSRGLWRLVLMEVSLFHHQSFVPARPKGLKFSKLPLEVSLATSFHTQLEMSS